MTDGDDPFVETGRLLFAREVEFVLGVAALKQLPEPDRPEICFAGRSNAGKSSLINALTGRKDLARTSNTPGRTQQLNYFTMAHPATGPVYLVDLPGYGFAKAPVKEVERWQGVLKSYLRGRATLRRAYVLIDSRHGIKAVDEDILKMLDTAAVSYQIVLTKADKPKATTLSAVVDATREAIAKRPAAFPEVIVTSSEESTGVAELRAAIARVVIEGR
jgi:GTP-binding protein